MFIIFPLKDATGEVINNLHLRQTTMLPPCHHNMVALKSSVCEDMDPSPIDAIVPSVPPLRIGPICFHGLCRTLKGRGRAKEVKASPGLRPRRAQLQSLLRQASHAIIPIYKPQWEPLLSPLFGGG